MGYYLGCSGWNYGEIPEKGGWIKFFIQTNKVKDFDITQNSSIQ